MENTLNIQITLNDEQLKDLIIGNINDLPKETLQEILLGSIESFLASEEGQGLFYEKDSYYGYGNRKPSRFLNSLIEKADIKDSITPTVNDIVEKFSNNYSEILRQCIMSCFSEMFMNNFDRHKLDVAFNQVMQNNN